MPISVQQMKAGIVITATLTGNMRGTYQLLAELEAIKRRVQKLSGKHIMYVHNVSGWWYFPSPAYYEKEQEAYAEMRAKEQHM